MSKFKAGAVGAAMSANKTYLGDSVYVEMLENEFGGFKLTTENGGEPSNSIYIEPAVFNSLVDWVKAQWEIQGKGPA